MLNWKFNSANKFDRCLSNPIPWLFPLGPLFPRYITVKFREGVKKINGKKAVRLTAWVDPPSPEAVRKMWKFFDKLSYLGLFCHFIKENLGKNRFLRVFFDDSPKKFRKLKKFRIFNKKCKKSTKDRQSWRQVRNRSDPDFCDGRSEDLPMWLYSHIVYCVRTYVQMNCLTVTVQFQFLAAL